MQDLVYLEDGKVKVSESAMQIQEFKDFKRYDRSEDNKFFDKTMVYIFYVYKVFGTDKENISYLANLPLSQRKVIATKSHTAPYTLMDFETNERVCKCIESYLLYSRTQSERLLDAFKEDLAKYISFVETIPLTINAQVKIKVLNPVTELEEWTTIEVPVSNIEERMKALKAGQDYKEMYSKWEQQVGRDQKIKQSQSRLLEDPKITKNIHTAGFPESPN